MSREHKEAEELLKAIFGDNFDTPPETPKSKKETPPETKGFNSLVSKEEYEAFVGIKEAIDKYIDVHNRNTIGMVHDDLSNSYAKVQYMMLCDVFDDLQMAVGTMYRVHELDKDFIDDLVKDSGAPSVEAFLHHMMMKKMLGK